MIVSKEKERERERERENVINEIRRNSFVPRYIFSILYYRLLLRLTSIKLVHLYRRTMLYNVVEPSLVFSYGAREEDKAGRRIHVFFFHLMNFLTGSYIGRSSKLKTIKRAVIRRSHSLDEDERERTGKKKKEGKKERKKQNDGNIKNVRGSRAISNGYDGTGYYACRPIFMR